MRDDILVIGGYGHVGQSICKSLGQLFPGHVIAAGRSLDRAEQFSRSTGGGVRPLQLDIYESLEPDLLDHVKLVVMCLDQAHSAFIYTCLERGVHYIDISASDSFHSAAENWHEAAIAHGATAVLGVGLAPGLTNLLARRAAQLMDKTTAIDISIMLGLGDSHGQAAIEWTIDNLNATYQVIQNGVRVETSSLTDGKVTDFGFGIGRKRAYRFNFSDQHTLPRTLGVPSVTTRLCLDSSAATTALAWLKTSGAVLLLNWKPIRQAMIRLIGAGSSFGQARFALKIDAWGCRGSENAHVECFLQGKREAEVTAQVAAAAAEILCRSSLPHGIYPIEQVFELGNILPAIQHEIDIQTRINGERMPI